MSVTWGFVVAIASGCVLMWALLTAALAQRAPHGAGRRAAGLAALVIMPIFVVVEVWFLALVVGRSWAPLPWVIAAAAGLAAAVLLPLMTTRTPRLTPDTRRRAVMNMAIIIGVSALIGEIFVFEGATRPGWAATVVAIAGVILALFSRRKSRAG